MKGKSLLRKWSSVSAAAAMLVGPNRTAATKGEVPDIDQKVSGGGDPYEPLVLKPPAARIIPEARFADHTSHASHASHASHYSGSGASQTYPSYSPPPSYSAPSPTAAQTPTPPAAVRAAPSVGPPSRIELTNGTVVYGNLLTKSGAGITFISSDGNTYKVERRWLTANTIAALGLPLEQTTAARASSPAAAEASSDAATLRQKIADLEQTVGTLRDDNAALRQQLRTPATKLSATPATPAPTPQPPSSSNPSAAQDNSQAFWLSSTGKRHNKRCRYYGTGRGHPCGPNDGVPCKICGG
jgi:hypothetical protein